MSFSYELEREQLDADADGFEPFQFWLVKGEERLRIGRAPTTPGWKGVHKHATGWSSHSPRVKRFLQENVVYRPSDVVIATYPKCGTTLTEQVVLLLLNGGDVSALDPLSKNSANLTGKFGKVWPEACVRSVEDCAAHDGSGPEEFIPRPREWFDVRSFACIYI